MPRTCDWALIRSSKRLWHRPLCRLDAVFKLLRSEIQKHRLRRKFLAKHAAQNLHRLLLEHRSKSMLHQRA